MATRSVNMSAAASRQSMAAPQGGVVKARQLAQLHAQLEQLSTNLADTENLLRITAVQAEAMRGLGSWHAGLLIAASKVLGEESVQQQQQQQKQQKQQGTSPDESR